MSTQEERLAELLSKTQEARYQFVRAELRAGFAAAELGMSELAQGNRESAKRELDKAEHGYEGIVHFLSVLDDGEPRQAVESEWARLRESLDQLQELLG